MGLNIYYDLVIIISGHVRTQEKTRQVLAAAAGGGQMGLYFILFFIFLFDIFYILFFLLYLLFSFIIFELYIVIVPRGWPLSSKTDHGRWIRADGPTC